MKYDLLIKHGRVVTEKGAVHADLGIKNGKIVSICSAIDGKEAKKIIDATGQYVLPGFIDPHVHLNDPGMTNSEDFYTGTCAAAAGGVTTVLEHPLTFPLPDNLKAFNNKKEIGESKAVIHFGLFGACSAENEKEMEKMIETGAIAFKTFLTYSPEIPMLNDGQIVDRMAFLSKHDIVLAIHCENNDIVEFYSKKMQDAGHVQPEDYPQGRPEISELEAVSRMCLFAHKTGCKMNVAHCTLEEAVQVVHHYKQLGADISVETCPHYLILHQDMMKELGVFSICNPPLRTEEEVEKLWNCIFDGKIDWICSDHATYTVEEKMAGKDNAFKAPAGVTSVETCFPLFFSEGVVKRGLSIEDFTALSSTNAAKRYRLYPHKGRIAEGADADVTILDPKIQWVIDDQKLKQMIKWSPYNGRQVTGKVMKTIVGGVEVYDGENIVAARGTGRYLTPVEEEVK